MTLIHVWRLFCNYICCGEVLTICSSFSLYNDALWKFLCFQIDVLVNRSRWQRSVFLKLSLSFKFPLKVRYFYFFEAQVWEHGNILACYGLNCLAGVLPKLHDNLQSQNGFNSVNHYSRTGLQKLITSIEQLLLILRLI